ncbi:hypothetical protein [Evansella tamaricis]|uniref:Uncharacterized protein n=1 Tax=Evansella tamaricis TaxID=2069301 RepID=A0ABS6JGC5_9BACI|nr:hypothetical protein [Evansella tamaricis]MBU9712729.1 hypothetical protein [Evansella tamaricis]
MWKKWSSFLAIIILFFLLAGCSSKASETFTDNVEAGHMAMSLGDYEEAMEAFQNALDEDAEAEEVKNYLIYAESLFSLQQELEEVSENSKTEVKELTDTFLNDIKNLQSVISEKEQEVASLSAQSGTNERLETELESAMEVLSLQEKKIEQLEGALQQYEELHSQVEQAQRQEREARENLTNPITIDITDVYTNTAGTIVEGEVQNISNFSLRSVKLRALFKDDNGNIIDSSETYPTSGTLLPSAKTGFRTSARLDNRITNVTVELIDFRTE